jgi:poly(A) polymerase/tRNA nucleotidyltransferase (CCA-adding enzyme)
MDLPEIILMIIDRLHRSGHKAYVVGGVVRDMCLGRTPTDWDVTTSASLEQIKTIFQDLRHFNLKHETVTIVGAKGHCEVTTFRGDENSLKTLKNDLGSRDFSINAMAYDVDKKEILDPMHGRRDLSLKLVRAVGEPVDRFREDPLRLLRAVRLGTELKFQIETKTLETISRMAEQLGSVSNERIRDELMKILLSKKPSVGFNVMLKTGLLRPVLPELLEGYLKKQNVRHRYTIYKHILLTVDKVEPDPTMRLCALLHDIAKPRVRTKINGTFRFFGHEKASAELAEEIMTRLRFSNEITRRVKNLISHHLIQYDTHWSDGAVRRLIRRVGPEDIDALLSFRRADLLAHGRGKEGQHLLSELKDRVKNLTAGPLVIKARDLAIDGQRVMEVLDLEPGPEVGKVLDELIERVTDHPELNTEGWLLSILKQGLTEKRID